MKIGSVVRLSAWMGASLAVLCASGCLVVGSASSAEFFFDDFEGYANDGDMNATWAVASIESTAGANTEWATAWTVENNPTEHGGWGYNVLPFIEQQTLYSMGAGLPEEGAEKKALITRRIATAVSTCYCPSRRGAVLYPFHFTNYPKNADQVTTTGKIDYCVNVGDRGGHTNSGPGNLAIGDQGSFGRPRENTGICFQRSEIKLSQITDGTSSTYMICGRNLNPDHYSDGEGPDDDGMCVGFDNDSCREAYQSPTPDTPGISLEDRFGSAHPAAWQAAMCDGSVHALSYSIDVEIHRRLGNRQDGMPVDIASL